MDREPSTAEEREALVSSFLEIATGETHATAVLFLQRTRWRIEDALQLFFADGESTRVVHAAPAPPPPATQAATAAVVLDDEGLRVQDHQSDFVMEPVGSEIKKQYCLGADVYYKLLPHQRIGLRWFWAMHCAGRGGILGDDMGLGKTRQVSSFIAGLIQSELIKNTLIVVPPILIDQWVNEMGDVGLEGLTNVFKDPKTRNGILQKVIKHGGILISSWGLIPGQWETLNKAEKWDYVIVDEGHKINRTKTKLFSSLQKICCSHRILITGTPMQNTLKELHTLLNFCCPGVFGSVEEFVETYLAPITDGNYKESTNEELIESSVAAAKLREVMKPFMLRRMKSEISEFPEKAELTVWLELSPYQKQLYRAFLRTTRLDCNKEAGYVLVATMLLGQICNHPDQLTVTDRDLHTDEQKLLKRLITKLAQFVPANKENDKEYQNSCKTEFVLKLLKNLYGSHKILIFSQTRETLDCIQVALSNKEYKFYRIDGRTKPTERKNIVEKFKAGGADILLLTTRVGGTGLDLPVATRTIILDPSWNPSTDNQCADRTYRLSQKNPVFVYRLISTSTIDEYIYETQLFKSGLFKMATENADYKRYICKHVKNEVFEMPNSFSTSRLQRKLVNESMKGERSKEVQDELAALEKLGYNVVSVHNRLFSETIDLPQITDGSWRQKKITKQRASPKVDRDYVIGGADYAFKPTFRPRRPVEIPSAPVLDEDDAVIQLRKAHRKDFLRDEIRNYTSHLRTMTAPDGNLKLNAYMEKLIKELAELESDADCRTKDQT